MTILVTGASGMIGSQLVKRLIGKGYSVIGLDCGKSKYFDLHYMHIQVDLGIKSQLDKIFEENNVNKVIHLAALAHTEGVKDLSYDNYYHVNVNCAVNVFESAAIRKIPILFISTVDVYGFTQKPVACNTKRKPVTFYGKTKAIAENELVKICKKEETSYSIYRLSPVYTDGIKRDIQKRYYLKYPYIAYLIGRGTGYEVLNIDNAIQEMIRWCDSLARNDIRIIKDPVLLNTIDCIKAERKAGRAKIVLWFPKWLVNSGYAALYKIFGENEKIYLLNKAVHPLRSEENK